MAKISTERHAARIKGLEEGSLSENVREVVFGIEDGLITVLGTILGVSTAIASSQVIVIAGIASLFAEAISMSAGAYLSAKSQREVFESAIEEKRKEVAENLEGEKEDLATIYEGKGLNKKEARAVVEKIARDKEQLLRQLVIEELGLVPERFERPIVSATLFGWSSIVGLVPLTPFLFTEDINLAQQASVFATMAVLFATGVVKAKFIKRPWLASGMEMLAIGLVAAAGGFVVGKLLAIPVPV